MCDYVVPAEDVEIFHRMTAYHYFENARKEVSVVTLRLSGTYHEDIMVTVSVGELEGG